MLKIKVVKDFRGMKAGEEFTFDTFPTILVGHNQCGKTSLLHALRSHKNDWDCGSDWRYNEFRDYVEIEHDYEYIFSYDLVNDLPTNTIVGYDAMSYVEAGGMSFQNKSHGESSIQALLFFYNKLMEAKEKRDVKALIILDEVDNGLDLQKSSKYYDILKSLGVNNDVIAVSHNVMTMLRARKVYSFKDKKIIHSKSYIAESTGYQI